MRKLLNNKLDLQLNDVLETCGQKHAFCEDTGANRIPGNTEEEVIEILNLFLIIIIRNSGRVGKQMLNCYHKIVQGGGGRGLVWGTQQ
jgi:hypothetical protein